ncbi:MAG: IPT/TIG domain-containing protein [Deltaproteobacteria bacterium]|nr:IPT/TIG domain-containing protein [Deltaproteobacteria bacterium]
MRSNVVVVAACLLGLVACNAPPTIRDVAVANDTSSPIGPYEVRATAFSDDGVTAASLIVDDGAVFLMAFAPEALGSLDVRLVGNIAGRDVGTVVRFAVEVCDAAGACARDPAGFPDEAHEFVVGNVPSEPRIDAVSPPAGPASGGQVVEITGAELATGVGVSFGDTPALHVERLRPDLLRVVTPAHVIDVVDVVVSNPDGAFTLLRSAYEFLPAPEVFSVAPATGPEIGGTRLTIEGANFPESARVVVDGVPCRRVELVSEGFISCETPPGRGVVDVAVLDEEAGGVGVFVDGFTYIPAPRLDAVTPDSGNSEGGQLITIIGADFQPGAVVVVGGSVCDDITVLADSITCTVPAGEPGVVDVVVVNPDGQSGILVGGYAHLGPPVIVAVIPEEGPVTGGVDFRVRILGAGLAVDDAVFFGEAQSPLVIDAIDDIELVVILPPSTFPLVPSPDSGFADVDVAVQRTRADDDRRGVLVEGFRYLWPPEVTSVSPPQGPTVGGTRVIVSGRFFAPSTTLAFDDVPCVDVEFLSSTELACTTPPGEAGPADVAAATDVLVGIGIGVFTYVPPPRVDSIEPAEGPTFGGELVTVRGAFFQPGALVFIDGAPCSNAVVVDEATILCTTPPGARGPADVQVINIDGQEDTAEGIYNYVGVAVTPDHGLPTGFTHVRVRAAGLQPGVVLTFDGEVASCAFVSARELDCESPAQPGAIGVATGLVEVRFRNPDGTTDGDDAFTYTAFRESQRAINNFERNANHVVIADVDDDGDGDVLVANGRVGTPESSVAYLNQGAFDFEATDIPGTEVTGTKIDVGSINNDDLPDLVISASNGTGAVLLRSTGPAAWATVELPLSAENSSFDAQLDDVIGDDRDDLLVLAIGCDPVLDFENNPGCDPLTFGVDVLFEQTGANGGSTLSRRNNVVPHDQGQTHDHKMKVTDLDDDGDNDIVIIVNNDPFESAQNRVLRNRINENRGFVKETVALAALVGDLYDIDAGDIDDDGDNDVVTSICFGDGAVSSEVVLRNTAGQLAVDDNAVPGFRTDCTIGVKLLDIDDDGDLDLLWSGSTDPRNNPRLLTRLYVNRGDGTFVDGSAFVPQPNLAMQGNNLDGSDLDGDGDLDLVIAAGAPYFETANPGAVLVLEQR